VMFLYGWEENSARQVCRGLRAEYSEFFISRSDSDSAIRHSLPVCLLRGETPDQTANTKGLVISGNEPGGDGPRVEVFVPSTGQQCSLPFLRDVSKGHTMEGTVVCGGGDGDTQTSCVNLTDDGTWERTATLLNRRTGHSSWASPSGIILLGGYNNSLSTEKIQNGKSSNSFDLKDPTAYACAINLDSSVILTGGYPDEVVDRVSQYSEAGWVRDLPQLLHERWLHGCSYYNNDDGTKTLLVTGGKGRRSGNFLPSLSSTELLKETASAWAFTSPLPSPRGSLKGANIDNKILMTGGGDWSFKDGHIYYDDILEFDPLTGQWNQVGRMKIVRKNHAVSVIDFQPRMCVEN